jgi:hypothetical protein
MVIIAALTYIKTVRAQKPESGLTIISLCMLKTKNYKHGKVNRGCFIF